jgi:hypothetical protein
LLKVRTMGGTTVGLAAAGSTDGTPLTRMPVPWRAPNPLPVMLWRCCDENLALREAANPVLAAPSPVGDVLSRKPEDAGALEENAEKPELLAQLTEEDAVLVRERGLRGLARMSKDVRGSRDAWWMRSKSPSISPPGRGRPR